MLNIVWFKLKNQSPNSVTIKMFDTKLIYLSILFYSGYDIKLYLVLRLEF